MVRFIHSSDWQIGMTRYFLEGEAQSRFTQDRIDAIRTLGQLAEAHDVQFMVVAGDVFEANQLSRQTIVRTLEALGEVSVPVFLLPGNHDPLDAGSLFRSTAFADAPDNVIVLDDELPRVVPGVPGVEVVGAPWTSKRPTHDLVSTLAGQLEPATETMRIVVAHGQVDTLTPEERPDIISLQAAEEAVRANKWHYLALGDRHSVTEVGTTGAIWYSSAPEATAFDEVRAGFALKVELTPGEKPKVEELPVGAWRFIVDQVAINGLKDVETFREWLAALPDKARSIVKVGFEGAVNLAAYGALESVMADFEDRFASLRQRKRTSDLAIVPDSMDEDTMALTGYARSAWEELVAAVDDPEDTAARDALALFYRLSQPQAGGTQ